MLMQRTKLDIDRFRVDLQDEYLLCDYTCCSEIIGQLKVELQLLLEPPLIARKLLHEDKLGSSS